MSIEKEQAMDFLLQTRARQAEVYPYLLPWRKTKPERFPIANGWAEWLGDPKSEKIILFLHGGGYVLGLSEIHRNMAQKICNDTGYRALLVDYRLAPEHPFPAALEDANASIEWLLDSGYSMDNIFVVAESAGAGLSLALMLQRKQQGKSLPKGAALMSPLADLTYSGKSITERYERDRFLGNWVMLELIAESYRGEEPASNPLISPVFADLSGLPPLFVQIGTEEVLYDDAVRIVARAKAAGTTAELQVWKDMWHAHQGLANFVPEGRRALRDISTQLLKWDGTQPSDH